MIPFCFNFPYVNFRRKKKYMIMKKSTDDAYISWWFEGGKSKIICLAGFGGFWGELWRVSSPRPGNSGRRRQRDAWKSAGMSKGREAGACSAGHIQQNR